MQTSFSTLIMSSFLPKSASFLYVKKSLQYIPHPLIITGRFGNGFPNEYQYTGTRDNSAYLAVKDSLEFRKKYGDKDIMEYMHELSIKAGELVAEIFGTEVLIKDTNKFGSINNIRMPIDNADLLQKAVNNTLFEDNTYVTNIEFDGHFYMRISCQIYNELNDYKYAANKFMKQLAKLNQNSES